MTGWRGLFSTIALMAVITAVGLTFGEKPVTVGTLREELTGKDQQEVIARLGPPKLTLKRPNRPGVTLVYPNALTAVHRSGHLLFDLDEAGRVRAVYVDQTLGPEVGR